MIDEARVKELRDTFGDSEFVELIGLFRDETEEIITSLRGQGETNVAEALHTLRGSAENMGLSDMSARCRRCELQAKDGHDPDVEEIAATFADGLRALSARLGLP